MTSFLVSVSSIVRPYFCLPLHFGLVNHCTQRTVPVIPYNQTETSENRNKKITKRGYYSNGKYTQSLDREESETKKRFVSSAPSSQLHVSPQVSKHADRIEGIDGSHTCHTTVIVAKLERPGHT